MIYIFTTSIYIVLKKSLEGFFTSQEHKIRLVHMHQSRKLQSGLKKADGHLSFLPWHSAPEWHHLKARMK